MLTSHVGMQALIPADKLRDYIAYARARCHPELTEPAAAKLVDSYLSLRGVGTSRKASPCLHPCSPAVKSGQQAGCLTADGGFNIRACQSDLEKHCVSGTAAGWSLSRQPACLRACGGQAC